MSTVWYEEVERGLQKEILDHVYYLSNTGIETALTEDKVFVRDPEEDLRREQTPCVTISSLYNKEAPERDYYGHKQQIVLGTDKENNTAEVVDKPVTMSLYYQIDFWSAFKEDMNLMTRTWLMKHSRQFNLDVVDIKGNEMSVNVVLNNRMTESNLLSNGKRLFHSIISYVIWVEIVPDTSYNVPMVAGEEKRVIGATPT